MISSHLIYHIELLKGKKELRFVSQQVNELLGVNEKEFEELILDIKEYREYFVHPEDINNVEKNHNKVYEKEESVIIEYRIKPKGKEKYFWVEEIVYIEKNKEEKEYLFGTINKVDKKKENNPEKRARLVEEKNKKLEKEIKEHERKQQKLEEQSLKVKAIFDNASNLMIWTMNKNLEVTAFNYNFGKTIKKQFNKSLKIGTKLFDLLGDSLKEEYKETILLACKKALEGNAQHLEGPLKDKRYNTIWVETYLNPLIYGEGKIEEFSCVSHEITEKKIIERQIRESLNEKEVLLKEVHHRVKNNLQVISSILNLQSSYVKDKNTLNILYESQNRIKSMAYIHESLYRTENFSSINFSEYIVNLSKNLVHSYKIYSNLVTLTQEVENINLSLDQAIPCGLILNELVSNALKYAYKENDGKGNLMITLKEKRKRVTIQVEDGGIGLPKGFNYKDTGTLGLQLVVTLVEQLEGSLEIKSEPGKGTKCKITFERIN